MTDAHHQDLDVALLKDWSAALAAFATSPENVRVYVLAVQFDPDYPEPVLALNTERGFERIVARYPNESPVELRRLGGPRWNPAEFGHFDIAPHSAVTKRMIEQFHVGTDGTAQTERVANVLVRALKKLSTSFNMLDRTPDFVSYVWPLDARESELIDLTRRTVPPALFNSLFPEVRATETLMASVAQHTENEQAAFWASALCDLVLETPTPAAQNLRALSRTQHDAAEALVNVGPAAIPELVRIAEEHGLAEEWNERNSEEWKRRGARTRRGDLASSALLALQDFNDVPDEIITRLQRLLRRLHQRDRNRTLAGVNGQLTARALHALRPSMFPAARFSDKTNHLLNFTDFA